MGGTAMRTRIGMAAIVLVAGAMTADRASAGGAPGMAALGTLEPGLWELRGRGEGAQTRRLCFADLRLLLQSEHRGALCPHFVISDSAIAASITYDCGSAGTGRTDLRIETSRLVQLRSQGVEDGAPFAMAAEGRRVGACP